MAPLTARRVDENEDDLLAHDEQVTDLPDTDLNDQPEKTVTPAVSDRRRRRQIKRGEVVESAPEPDEDDDDEAEAISPVRKDRPTPSQRDEKEVSGNFIARAIENLKAYIADTRGELLKVSWPTREETQRLSIIVLIVTAVAAAFLGIVSYIFSFLTSQIASQNTTIIAGAIAIALIIIVSGAWLLRDRFFGSID